MNETSKAMRRRMKEDDDLIFPWREIFRGKMLDVGCGPDPLRYEGCIGFDSKDGDANKLSQYFEPESFDLLAGSHVLEHMADPRAAMRDWLKIVKPGGYVLQTVPDWVAYERMQWPSRFNGDHKSSWSMLYLGSIAPIHIHIPTFLKELEDIAEILLARYVERNFNWKLPADIDQTWREEDGVEIWNEFLIRKK